MRLPASGTVDDSAESRVTSRALWGFLGAMASTLALTAPTLAQDAPPPNILVIMGDDIGWSNIGVYNQGFMSGRTPHLYQLAN